jgi:hypothetical protein
MEKIQKLLINIKILNQTSDCLYGNGRSLMPLKLCKSCQNILFLSRYRASYVYLDSISFYPFSAIL